MATKYAMRGEAARITIDDGRAILHRADCRDVVAGLADNSMDSVVCDPPYALVSVTKRFGKAGSAPAKHGRDGLYARASAGFMGKQWDTGEVAFAEEFWADIVRVLKPGGHVVAFGGTRTYHRLACAIEDAGFEIRDCLVWHYGQGFPKSHDAGDGWGTALKPATELIAFGRKPLSVPIGDIRDADTHIRMRNATVAENRGEWGTGAINIEACRVPVTGADVGQIRTMQRGPRVEDGYGMGETVDAPVVLPEGRWPANLLHDGSDEVLACFPDAVGQQGDLRETGRARPTVTAFGDMGPPLAHAARIETDKSAARFFYCAKTTRSDRDEGLPERGNTHPTVKPTNLMRWLCRLVTPAGGTVLDPFMGSGSTGKAALLEGFRFVGVERETEYMPIAAARVEWAASQPQAAPANKKPAANDNEPDIVDWIKTQPSAGAA